MFKKIVKWYKDKYKMHDHTRDLFVTTNGYAFVKCTECGAESMPWKVSLKQARDFNENHPGIFDKLKDIDQKREYALCRNNL